MIRRMFLGLLSGLLLVCPFLAHAGNADLSLDSGSISFSTTTLYAGDTIRLYARVRNVGDVDVSAYVLFYQGGSVIGASQPVSTRAGGNPDDVYVDFVVPTGSFNIRAVLQGSSPQDMNPANDATQTPLYTPIVDSDRDGVGDDEDNCVGESNADQRDQDQDGIGDVCDDDIDGDGVENSVDAYPYDSSKSHDEPVVAPTVKTQAEPVVSVSPSSPVQLTPSNVAPSPSSPDADSSVDDDAGSASVAVITSTSRLTTSPLARFTWEQRDWRTYEFTLAEQPTDGVLFSWDFGDGATSVQPQITHAFAGPGTYDVTLTLTQNDGTVLSDAQTFDVTFFHLDNPQVVGIMAMLMILLFLFGFIFMKLRSGSWEKGDV